LRSCDNGIVTSVFATLTTAIPLASISSSVIDAIGHHGVLAVFGLMALDALLPVGGELIMLYAGVIAAGVVAGAHPSLFGFHPHSGFETYLLLVLAGSVGYLLGALVGWAIGAWGGRPLLERHGRWVHLSPARLAQAQRWFDRFGGAAVFLGRLTPVARSFVSIPAGAFERRLPSYAILTFLGNFIWCAAFAAVGWAVSGSWESIHHAFRYVDYVVVAAVILLVGWLLFRARQRSRDTTPVRSES
jgi:membrane protein DedA with SNARE-associated domain